MTIDWKRYPLADAYDELVTPSGRVRRGVGKLAETLARMSDEELETRRGALELAIKEMGITFTVYSEEEGSIDRNWPLDLIPRIIRKREWDAVEAGLVQRVRALNLFIDDLYHDQRCIADGVFPQALLDNSVNFRPQCVGIDPPLGIWAHLCGNDRILILDRIDTILVQILGNYGLCQLPQPLLKHSSSKVGRTNVNFVVALIHLVETGWF